VIRATQYIRSSELWSWSFEGGHYPVKAFGVHGADADESNAVQLWNCVFLAVWLPSGPPSSRRSRMSFPRTLLHQVAIYVEPPSALANETAALVLANGGGIADTMNSTSAVAPPVTLASITFRPSHF
jgi:hypothetical protein